MIVAAMKTSIVYHGALLFKKIAHIFILCKAKKSFY